MESSISISAFDCGCVSGNTGKHLRTGKRTLSSSDCHGVRHMVFRMQRDMPECAGAGISTLESVKRDWLRFGLVSMEDYYAKGGLLVKLIEPPCTERYARWCERSVGEIIAYLLLDSIRHLLPHFCLYSHRVPYLVGHRCMAG